MQTADTSIAAPNLAGSMTLDEWMKAEGLDNAALAERIGVSDITVYRVRTGRQKPSFDLIEKFIAHSDHRLDGNSFFKRALVKAAASRGGDASDAPFSSTSSPRASRPRGPRRPRSASPPAASPPPSAKRSCR